ncbi:MAG: plasmid pRiA4b ORF-3 family protein [Pseudomonadota bacterium]
MPSKKATSTQVYQIKVTLEEISPAIWRRLQVTSDTTLFDLHGILQVVMGWTDSHLHEFDLAGTLYGDAEDSEGEVLDEKPITLEQLIIAEGEKFQYLYDLGDGWKHEILVEKVLTLDPGTTYPVCIAGDRACPPEDCGGVSGYEELLTILGDSSHDEHEDKFHWLPGDFDSEKLDIESVNKELRDFQR